MFNNKENISNLLVLYQPYDDDNLLVEEVEETVNPEYVDYCYLNEQVEMTPPDEPNPYAFVEDVEEEVEYEYDDKEPILANIVKMYKCPNCDFATETVKNFVEHHNSHLEQSYAPQQDQPTTISPDNIIVQYPQEIQSNSNDDNKQMFLCGQCYSVFETMDLCREHMIEFHKFESIVQSEIETTTSNMIEQTSSQGNDDENVESSLTDNEEIEDKEDEPTDSMTINSEEEIPKPISLQELKIKLTKTFILRCSVQGCIYKFETAEKRDKHFECHVSLTEPDKIRNFKCYECASEYKRWRECTHHMWKEHKIDIDLLKCPVCDYKSMTSVFIYRHMQIHGSSKGYVCSYCSKKFMQSAQLKNHVLIHTKDKNSNQSRWYSQKTCEICGHLFCNSRTLSKHIKAVHNKIKPFICNVCGYKSARKSTWQIHMNQHTGDKPYECKVCDFRARDPACMARHALLHTHNNPYKCNYCTFQSVQSIALKRHVKSTHPTHYYIIKCDQCAFISVNEDILERHIADHKSGLIPDDGKFV